MASIDHALDRAEESDAYIYQLDPYETSMYQQERASAFEQEQEQASLLARAVLPPKLLQPVSLREQCFSCLRQSEASALARRLQPLLVGKSFKCQFSYT